MKFEQYTGIAYLLINKYGRVAVAHFANCSYNNDFKIPHKYSPNHYYTYFFALNTMPIKQFVQCKLTNTGELTVIDSNDTVLNQFTIYGTACYITN